MHHQSVETVCLVYLVFWFEIVLHLHFDICSDTVESLIWQDTETDSTHMDVSYKLAKTLANFCKLSIAQLASS